jgi:sterol desaturase/sphingolipid hydroxylase (fatty acid hydroxylase superfamily)
MSDVSAVEPVVRLAAFAGTFCVLALLEYLWPVRRPVNARRLRWPVNFGMVAIDTLILRVLLPGGVTGLAILADERGWGVLRLVSDRVWVKAVVGFVVLDLAVYVQHVALHRVPVLWRLHVVHHSDVEVDATTGVRFHPAEILLSFAWKGAVVLVLGPPPFAVLAFEVALAATSLFNHANVHMPHALEPWVRAILVTPAMHRVHHSTRVDEQNSNFGFNLPWWDRLLGTYRPRMSVAESVAPLGVNGLPLDLGLRRLLILPWRPGP